MAIVLLSRSSSSSRHRSYRFQYLTILQFFLFLLFQIFWGSFCSLWIALIVCALCGIRCCFCTIVILLLISGIVSRAMFAPESLLIPDSEWREGNERHCRLICSSSSSRISFFLSGDDSLLESKVRWGIMKWLHKSRSGGSVAAESGEWQTYMAVINGLYFAGICRKEK